MAWGQAVSAHGNGWSWKRDQRHINRLYENYGKCGLAWHKDAVYAFGLYKNEQRRFSFQESTVNKANFHKRGRKDDGNLNLSMGERAD